MIGAGDILESYTERDPNSGCWLWSGNLGHNGYGLVRYEGRLHRAHRLAFASSGRDLENGFLVCHKCDVRACVNPDHLWLGTALDNIRDCQSKGRRFDPPIGAPNRQAKLNDDSVRQILDALKAGGSTLHEIGKRFGVSGAVIGYIKNGKSWKHIERGAEAND